MRGLAKLGLAAAGAMLLSATPAFAACTFPTLNLGSFISGDRSSSSFARDAGGTVQVGAAIHYHARITGCAADARYRLSTGASTPVRVTNGGQSLDLVPFVVAINGTTLATPVDLTRPNSLVFTGNPDLEIIVAVTASEISLAGGHYNGGFVMQFTDP